MPLPNTVSNTNTDIPQYQHPTVLSVGDGPVVVHCVELPALHTVHHGPGGVGVL
jgi:hypothetical protein